MIREQALRARQRLVSKLLMSGEFLRGSLLERTGPTRQGLPEIARSLCFHLQFPVLKFPLVESRRTRWGPFT
jgi:hypothetical protein